MYWFVSEYSGQSMRELCSTISTTSDLVKYSSAVLSGVPPRATAKFNISFLLWNPSPDATLLAAKFTKTRIQLSTKAYILRGYSPNPTRGIIHIGLGTLKCLKKAHSRLVKHSLSVNTAVLLQYEYKFNIIVIISQLEWSEAELHQYTGYTYLTI